MKRKYNAKQAMTAIELLRKHIPNVQFTTDVIVGFPQETDEDFYETCEFVRKAKFLNVHIFPYSKRKGTLAETMDGQIPTQIKKKRLKELEEIVEGTRLSLLSDIIDSKAIKTVLFETYKDGIAYGHTPEFIEVAVNAPHALNGKNVQARLSSTDGSICYGEIVSLDFQG
jgi:threonylcarbamoyladenosine tRNA methylthiotransferase MtaB